MPLIYYNKHGLCTLCQVETQMGPLLLALRDGFRLYMDQAANATDSHSEKVISTWILFPSDYTKEEVSVGS